MLEGDHITRRRRVDNSKRRTDNIDAFSAKGLAAEESFSDIEDSINQHEERREIGSSLGGIMSAVTLVNFTDWTNIVLMVSLIFGGCCANVFALEAIIKDQPTSGSLITFAQFILTALFTLPSFMSLSAGPRSLFIGPRAIPLRSWLIYTAFFVTVNLLNNWAFAYKISVPLHIILRSGGPVASMIVGYLFNSKRYSPGQVLAVVMLTLGVVTAALADAHVKGQPIDLGSEGTEVRFTQTLIGFTILALAMVLSAFQGIYADRLYEAYGRNHWKEALFYSHTLSLPLFIPTYSHLLTQWHALFLSPPLLSKVAAFTTEGGPSNTTFPKVGGLAATTTFPFGTSAGPLWGSFRDSHLAPFLAMVPMRMVYLLMNALTQYLCIRGVHYLSAKSSSLTVTIVLNIRKLLSLVLSIYLFGNDLALGVLVGGFLVFSGGALYGFEGARLRRNIKKD
ncbi:putative UPD-GlcNAc transporter (Mnn2-2) [Aspergillus steynii IBT 23096]|uniref:Putative UPD-GlcNAc transporter (Mnn2-2) n=1 Tax=Aspergillus steynii IBT 23096 TaxID=1392250 RepID=A0A2I2G6S7_9EURO|nr:putative UPD-GlcNAc transporter (Mnn2-2) [Aspergillus steynii IBT 23096]PLB48577.1 putative UPD-GlcNAc transporter (Mnn2-2) [Aspergillus steynii IBT 23096]